MPKLKRELLNILFIGAGASLIHAAFEAAHVKFDLDAWAAIVMGIAVALSGYVVFEYLETTERRAAEWQRSAAERETEWLSRVGTPARLDSIDEGQYLAAATKFVRELKPGSDFTAMIHIPRQGRENVGLNDFGRPDAEKNLKEFFRTMLELVDAGTIREYRRIICFEPDIFARSADLKSGILRVGDGPEMIWGLIAEHCRLMTGRKQCSAYLAPAIVQNDIFLFGTGMAAITLRRFDPGSGVLQQAYGFFFSDPPNSEIIEELRRIVMDTEKRMVAVHSIVDDSAPLASAVSKG
jgi:hypothetical protein